MQSLFCRSLSPSAYYLKGDLVRAELDLESAFSEYMQLHGYTQLSSPDMVKTSIAVSFESKWFLLSVDGQRKFDAVGECAQRKTKQNWFLPLVCSQQNKTTCTQIDVICFDLVLRKDTVCFFFRKPVDSPSNIMKRSVPTVQHVCCNFSLIEMLNVCAIFSAVRWNDAQISYTYSSAQITIWLKTNLFVSVLTSTSAAQNEKFS